MSADLPTAQHASVPSTPPTPAAGGGQSRRRYQRLVFGLAAHCQVEGRVFQEQLGDLSAGGLYLESREPLLAGTRIKTVLGLPYIGGPRICSLSGRIVRVDRSPDGAPRGAGVQFDADCEAADLELLENFLALWGVDSAVPDPSSEAPTERALEVVRPR